MAAYVFNVSKGTIIQRFNTSATSFRAIIIRTDRSAAQLGVATTITGMLALGTTTKVTTTNATPSIGTSTKSGTTTLTLDSPNIDFGVIAAGAATNFLVIYEDISSNADATNVPLTLHDFVITPDGSSVTATVSDYFSVT